MRYQAKNSEFHLRPPDLQKLIAAADNLRDRLVISLFVYTGLRRGELQKIRIDDLDAGRCRLLIRRGKGSKQRLLYLPDHLVRSIEEHCSGRSAGFLFPGSRGGPMTSRNINYIVTRVARAAGVRTPNPRYTNVGPHLLRHSFARNWKVAGGSLESLQKILGHSSLKTTLDVYGTESVEDTESNYRSVIQSIL
jgi:integrase/recombinase XerD